MFKGPIPLRSEERQRTNPPATPILKTGVEDIAAAHLPFPIDVNPMPPSADELAALDPDGAKWHPVAQHLWDAVCRSPEAMWMTSAGWAILVVECEQLSRELSEQFVGISEDGEMKFAEVPMKGASLAAHHKIWAAMGLLEGDRRRMGREVTLHPALPTDGPLPDGVTDIATRRDLLTPRETGS